MCKVWSVLYPLNTKRRGLFKFCLPEITNSYFEVSQYLRRISLNASSLSSYLLNFIFHSCSCSQTIDLLLIPPSWCLFSSSLIVLSCFHLVSLIYLLSFIPFIPHNLFIWCGVVLLSSISISVFIFLWFCLFYHFYSFVCNDTYWLFVSAVCVNFRVFIQWYRLHFQSTL